MIKVRKIDFAGYNVSISNCGVVLLVKDRLAEISEIEPEEFDFYSKISCLQNDYTLTDIVSEKNTELFICVSGADFVVYGENIYEENEEHKRVFRSTRSQNEYIASYNASWNVYGDYFVIEEYN